MNWILFLCTGNFYRSRFCEEYFNHKARNRRLNWRAKSRGLSQDINSLGNVGKLSKNTKIKLDALGIPFKVRDPEALLSAEIDDYQKIVALDKDEHESYINKHYPEIRNKVLYLDVKDINAEETNNAFDRMMKYIDEMIVELNNE